MTVINEHTSYCAVCGGPIEDPDVDDTLCTFNLLTFADSRNQLDHSWLSHAVALEYRLSRSKNL